jgi:hypothetical protein
LFGVGREPLDHERRFLRRRLVFAGRFGLAEHRAKLRLVPQHFLEGSEGFEVPAGQDERWCRPHRGLGLAGQLAERPAGDALPGVVEEQGVGQGGKLHALDGRFGDKGIGCLPLLCILLEFHRRAASEVGRDREQPARRQPAVHLLEDREDGDRLVFVAVPEQEQHDAVPERLGGQFLARRMVTQRDVGDGEGGGQRRRGSLAGGRLGRGAGVRCGQQEARRCDGPAPVS